MGDGGLLGVSQAQVVFYRNEISEDQGGRAYTPSTSPEFSCCVPFGDGCWQWASKHMVVSPLVALHPTVN